MDKSITISDLRKNMKHTLDELCNNHEVLLATRQKGGNVVLMSEEDYLALNETAYLLKSSNNRKRLSAAMKSAGQRYKSLEEMESALGI